MIRKLILLFAAASCGLAAHAQNNYGEVIKYEEIDGMIVFPLTVNGVKCKFLFDPKHSLRVLEDDAEKLGFLFDLETSDYYNGTVGEIRKVNLGNIIFKDKMLAFSVDNEFMRRNGISGSMSPTLFMGYVVTIDSRNKTLTITTPYRPKYVNIKNKIDMEKNNVSLKYDIGGKTITADIDMACGEQVLTLSPDDAALFSDGTEARTTITRRDTTYVKRDVAARRLNFSELPFANDTIRNADVYAVDGQKSSMLGAGILKKGIISLDYAMGRMYFQSYEKTDPASIESYVLASPSPEDGGNDVVKALNRLTFPTAVFDYKNKMDWEYEGSIPAIVDFWAPWCGPCRELSPKLEELAAEYAGKVKIYKVNVDQEPEIAAYFGVNQLPTMLLIPMKGEPAKVTGNLPKEEIVKRMESIFGKQ